MLFMTVIAISPMALPGFYGEKTAKIFPRILILYTSGAKTQVEKLFRT